MKIIVMVILSFLPSVKVIGSEGVLSLFSEFEIGSKMSSGEAGFAELPDFEVFGHQFSAYCELDENNAVKSVGFYSRSDASDESATELTRAFDRIKRSIVSETGEAGEIEAPNFQDATERSGSLFAWKDPDSILVLEKIHSPGRTEVIIRHSDFKYYTSNLGADTGDFLLPRIEAMSGELKIPLALSPP